MGQDPRPGLPDGEAHALVPRCGMNLPWWSLFSEGETPPCVGQWLKANVWGQKDLVPPSGANWPWAGSEASQYPIFISEQG